MTNIAATTEQRISQIMLDYWKGLLHGRRLPSLRNFDPTFIASYKENTVLIDLRDDEADPRLQVIGRKLAADVPDDLSQQPISHIPTRTMLDRLTHHYHEVLANQAPITFEAEFFNTQQERALYRGILLPLSDDGEKINFMLGALNWVIVDDVATHRSHHDIVSDNLSDSDSPLRRMLAECRALVQGHTDPVGNPRHALYEALSHIYSLHLFAESQPDEYAALLRENNLKQQKRAPFTTTLKLCFGKDYDKTRLTEYAGAMAYAQESGQSAADFLGFIEHHPGGIKGCVLARRAARHEGRGDKIPTATLPTDRLRQLASKGTLSLSSEQLPDGEFFAILARRTGDKIEMIATADQTDRHVSRLLKKTARNLGQTKP